MKYTEKLQINNATTLQADLSLQLTEINEKYEIGDNSALDNIHNDFVITINGLELSLGSMDTYNEFCKFLDTIINNT